MKKILCILFILVILGVGFLLLIKNPQSTISQKVLPLIGLEKLFTGTTTLANPATLFCLQNSGTSEIVTDSSGGQSGLCHLPDGTICDERAYFRGECPTTGIELIGAAETSGGLMDQVSQEIANQQTNVFMYQPLGLSFIIPAGRSAKVDTTNPCAETNCSFEGMRITTDEKDDLGYIVYIFLNIKKFDETTKGYQEYINKIDVPNGNDEILVDQTDRKLIQLEGISGLGSFILKTKGEYFYIEIFEVTSEQPRPANLDDVRNPTIPNENIIYEKLNTIIESITK